jgi:hypothetical protein
MDAYVKDMVSKQLGAKLRSKISEEHTLPIEAYNPQGFESLPT